MRVNTGSGTSGGCRLVVVALVLALVLLSAWWGASLSQLLPVFSATAPLTRPPPSSKESSRRIFIDGSNLYNPTGGNEALLQLSLAFFSVAPHQTGLIRYKEGTTVSSTTLDSVKHLLGYRTHRDDHGYSEFIHPQLQAEYPLATQIPVGRVLDLAPGDLLVLAEIEPCPEDLVARGVHVYVWVLGANHKRLAQLSRSGCSALSHNYWLSSHLGTNISSTAVLRPYLTPSLLPQPPLPLSLKEDLILIDNDTPPDVIATITQLCSELKCSAVVVKGFTRAQLVQLYRRAKVVVDWCMRGSERMPIEAVLHGAVLVSSACECVQDRRDFPLPPRNIIPHVQLYPPLLRAALERVLGSYLAEYEGYDVMRTLYGSTLSAQSLSTEVGTWYHTNYH